MITWWSIVNAAKGEVGMTVPTDRITDRVLLHWASEAQHLYQVETRAVEREWTKGVISGTTEYPMPLDARHSAIAFVSLVVPSGSTGGGKLTPISWDEYVRRTTVGFVSPSASPALLSPQTSLTGLSGVVFAYNRAANTLHLYPGVEGTITVRYIPELSPFFTDDEDEWGDFGDTPTAMMKETGPELAMYPAVTGIKAWVKVRILENIEGVLPKVYTLKYSKWMAEFEAAKARLAREATDYSSNQPIPYTAGVF